MKVGSRKLQSVRWVKRSKPNLPDLMEAETTVKGAGAFLKNRDIYEISA